MRRALPALALLAAGWALTIWVGPWSDDRVNDLFVYRTFAEPVLHGGLPYRDVAFEYPPLAVPAIVLPGLAGTGDEAFRWAFALWTLGAAVAVVLLCGALAGLTGAEPRRAMFAAALAPLLLGALLRTHFDLFPVALLLAGLLLLCRDQPRAGLAVLGLGAMTKAFPLVAVPVALAWLVGRGRRRDAWQGALACAAVILVVAGVAVAASPRGAAAAVRYHQERPVQIESSPALVLLGLDAAGVGHAASVSSHRSAGLVHPADDAVTSLFVIALVALVAIVCAAVASRTADGAGVPDVLAGSRQMVLGALAATVGFALFGKVLSPQFVIWAIPLGALAFAWGLHALAAAVVIAAVLTWIEFPAHYFEVVAREPLAIGLVALRNLALLAVIVLSVRELRPRREGEEFDAGELQPRRQEELLDGRRPALAVRLD